MRATIMAAAAAVCLAGAAPAWAPVSFDGWAEQRFSLFFGNEWRTRGTSLEVRADGTVSMLWSALPEAAWGARAASWRWSVARSVPPTDLTRRGGDDRNLALYFIFMPAEIARAHRGKGIRALLDVDEARVLMYVWGGAHPRGAVLPTPYLGARGRTVALRPAGEGAFAEQVDLDADHRRAFGAPAASLVGLAVSADADDTDSALRARLEDLRLSPVSSLAGG
ncbi:DUF3047 domain-containing protein [Oceanicella actignis]|uniref:DUF3047 domain-containing protein n=1 Tax=Oceanicella actignis TaxID=1189325 RepID=A0A1M7TL51_9RHOB|nr:DUF3047 domain-containing protein [Oceanicella actignis]SET68859.1 Protein of unknown function [Oceanicella actignis]SHN71353.1 Protein of unknown function [Oceanicella actignis]